MEIGDSVSLNSSILRWNPDHCENKRSGIIVGVIHHTILNAFVYEVMWSDGSIARQYVSDLDLLNNLSFNEKI